MFVAPSGKLPKPELKPKLDPPWSLPLPGDEPPMLFESFVFGGSLANTRACMEASASVGLVGQISSVEPPAMRIGSWAGIVDPDPAESSGELPGEPPRETGIEDNPELTSNPPPLVECCVWLGRFNLPMVPSPRASTPTSAKAAMGSAEANTAMRTLNPHVASRTRPLISMPSRVGSHGGIRGYRTMPNAGAETT